MIFRNLGDTALSLGPIILVIIFLIWATTAWGHDIYGNWRLPDVRSQSGFRYYSCCNNVDCAPRATRFLGDHWEVLWEGKWLRVPASKVETEYPDAWDPGDNRGHACISKLGNIYCFRPGEWLQ